MHVIILHGIESHAGDHWERWLSHELEERKHTVSMPELPNAIHPDRFEWLRYVKVLLDKVRASDLIMVAHSLGVVTALDYIEQSDKKIHGLISVSGFADDYGAELNGYFMRQKELSIPLVKEHLNKRFVLYGDDDPYVPQETLANLASYLEVTPTVIAKGGHLNTQAGYTVFPILLDLVKNLEKKKS